MVFNNVDIAPGSTIDLVQHWWRAYDNYSNTCSFKWQFENTDDSQPCDYSYPAGRNYVGPHNYISSYTTSWTSGSWYGVQNLAAGLQNVIDRSGWSSGNSVGLKWCAYSSSGGYRWVRSYDYSSSSAPYLYVEYSGGEHCYSCPTYDHAITPPDLLPDTLRLVWRRWMPVVSCVSRLWLGVHIHRMRRRRKLFG